MENMFYPSYSLLDGTGNFSLAEKVWKKKQLPINQTFHQMWSKRGPSSDLIDINGENGRWRINIYQLIFNQGYPPEK